jgi:hypothetical protein
VFPSGKGGLELKKFEDLNTATILSIYGPGLFREYGSFWVAWVNLNLIKGL